MQAKVLHMQVELHALPSAAPKLMGGAHEGGAENLLQKGKLAELLAPSVWIFVTGRSKGS